MVKFRCNKCNFQFDRATQPKLCPFCGTESSVYEESNAEDILRNVDDIVE
jgi:rubrerythrin